MDTLPQSNFCRQTLPSPFGQVGALLQVPLLARIVVEVQQASGAQSSTPVQEGPDHELELDAELELDDGLDVDVELEIHTELERDTELDAVLKLDAEIDLDVELEIHTELEPDAELDAVLDPAPVLASDPDADPVPELDAALEDALDATLDDALEPPSLRCPASIPASLATSNWVVPQRTSAAPARSATTIEPFVSPGLMDHPPVASAAHAVPSPMQVPVEWPVGMQQNSPELHPPTLVQLTPVPDPDPDVVELHALVHEQTLSDTVLQTSVSHTELVQSVSRAQIRASTKAAPRQLCCARPSCGSEERGRAWRRRGESVTLSLATRGVFGLGRKAVLVARS